MTSRLLYSEPDKEMHEILTAKAETMAREIQDLNEEKLNCSLNINNLITNKYQEFKFNNVMHHQPWDLTPRKFNPEPGSSTPLDMNKNETPVPKKRGRKPKNATKENRQESIPIRDSVESSDLMMLADVALIQKEEEASVVQSFGKLPITKHSKKSGKNRKVRKSKSTRDESDSDSEATPAEADENEPLYCICNRISFGNMVECSNDSCSIEWFHFGCIGMRKAPKGKWYCPKCRSRKANVRKIKKELVA
jgi:hypothetical protein